MRRSQVAKTDKKQPWLKFYPSDWSGDRKLHMCSIGARGLWVEMMCVMHEAEPYGHLVTDGKPVTNRQIASLAGVPLAECGRYMMELESAGVYSRTDTGTIFSRRMVRDKAKAEQDHKNGKGGGNPQITDPVNEGVNPPDKAQKPETKFQPSDSKNRERDFSPSKAEVLTRQEGDGTPITEAYQPSERAVEYAYSLGMKKADLESELEKFKTRAIALRQISFDHDMSFKLWCDRWLQYQKKNYPERFTAATTAVAPEVDRSDWQIVVEGTNEHTCWNIYQREQGQRPLFVCKQIAKDGTEYERAAKCPTLFPPGFNDFGERIHPANSEENAA